MNDDVMRVAEQLGHEHGTAAGSWVVDGNTSTETARRIVQLSEDGCFWDEFNVPSPLGEGYTDAYNLRDLILDCEASYRDTLEDTTALGLYMAYEDAWYEAFEHQAIRDAIALLPELLEGDNDDS